MNVGADLDGREKHVKTVKFYLVAYMALVKNHWNVNAIMAGPVCYVKHQYVLKHVTKNMDIVVVQMNVDVVLVGSGIIVRNVSLIRDVKMDHVLDLGSVTVQKGGEVYYVMKN